MTTPLKIISFAVFLVAMVFAGCYTQLMTPDQYLQSKNEHPVIRPDMSSNIQYSSNCISCHSQQELDDRYYDMQAYGITSAHGFRLDPSMWAVTSDPMYDPPYFPDGPGVETYPWWLPPPVIVTTPAGTSAPAGTGDRPRNVGATRDNPERPRSDTPTPAASSPSAPPASTSTSTPPPASTSTSQPPAQTPASSPGTTERSRNDDSSSSSSRTRSEGASRDNNGNRPR